MSATGRSYTYTSQQVGEKFVTVTADIDLLEENINGCHATLTAAVGEIKVLSTEVESQRTQLKVLQAT